eukprot:7268291-Pyramimonas_sp.AAC.1
MAENWHRSAQDAGADGRTVLTDYPPRGGESHPSASGEVLTSRTYRGITDFSTVYQPRKTCCTSVDLVILKLCTL